MTGRAVTLATFAWGVDCLQPFATDAELDAFVTDAGMTIDYVGRYLENLFKAEVTRLHAASYSVLLFCEARISPLSAETGIEDGTRELGRLRVLEVPEPVSVVIDLEEAHGEPSDVDAHVRAMSHLLSRAGYAPKLYVGDRCVLDSHQLYALPDVHGYLASPSLIPEPLCGYMWRQMLPLDWTGHGRHRAVDVSVAYEDRRGRRLAVWAP